MAFIPSLIDLPVHILQLVLLLVEAADPSYADVVALCLTHPRFHQFLTGQPCLRVTFPRHVVEPFNELHDTFIERCTHILDGLQENRNFYVHGLFQLWFDEYEELVGRRGIAELIFSVLRLDFVELLCGTLPPTVDELLALAEDETAIYMAAYILLVKHGIELLVYSGSATDQTKGFLRRQSEYFHLSLDKMPKFIRDLTYNEEKFRVLVVLPILRLFPMDQDDIIYGDMRVPVYLIETVMMVWFRTLKKGSAWEKLMVRSPWTVEQMQFVGSNYVPSTKLEWPKDTILTLAEREARMEGTTVKNKAYKQSEHGKAMIEAYTKSERGKAVVLKGVKKYLKTDKGKATRKAWLQTDKGIAYRRAKGNRLYARKRLAAGLSYTPYAGTYKPRKSKKTSYHAPVFRYCVDCERSEHLGGNRGARFLSKNILHQAFRIPVGIVGVMWGTPDYFPLLYCNLSKSGTPFENAPYDNI